MSMMKRLLTILSICVLCITAQAQIVIGVTRTGQVGTADQNLEFVDQFGRIMAYPSLGPTGELLDAMRPAVATNLNVSDVTKVSATTGGKVIAEGASAVTECGVCFSTSTNPTTQDAHVTATPDADGNFTVSLTGLQPNTTYHVRAYATNAIGTSYGTAATFTTRGDATITITGNMESKTYNGSAQSVTGYTVTIPDGINITADQITYSGNAAATGTNVGTYTLTLSADDFSCTNANYDVNFTVTNGSLTITRADATVTITGNTDTKTYSGAVQSVTGYTVGIPDGVNIAATEIAYSGNAIAQGMVVGTWPMNLSVANFSCSNGNYNVTFQVTDGALTITKAQATITINDATKVYGEDDPDFSATVTGLQGNDQSNFFYTFSRQSGEDAGTYAITATPGDNPNYNVTVVPGTLTITKATATVTADNATKVYGAADPTFTATVTGVQSGDQLNYTLARATGENAGTYAINVTLGDNPNYEVTTTAGTFTITKATATVTANNASKVYGATDPTFTATVTGVQSGDQLNYTLARVTGENAGTYAINVTLGDNPNYEVTTTAGTFTITKATATVTADAKTKVYGVPDPTFTATVTGVQSGDQLNYTLARVTGENAGTYDINVNLGDNPNYDVTATKGTFTINKATATVTAADKSKTYGASDPELTATVTGAVNNETLNYTLARATGENAGTYDITVTPGSNPNYEVTTANGTFTINKATAIVTAADKSKTYGASDPELTATVTGAVNNETLNYTLSRANGESAGTYAITVTLGSNPNYEVTAANGTFTINKATATVTADNKSKTYGATDPTLTATVTGVVNNETLNYTLTRANGENAGEYAITVNLGSNPNYEVTSTNGTFTINKATATVTADAKSKTYGAADPELTATVTGAVNNETLNYTLARATGENAGEYAITVTLGSNPNYEVTATNGTFTINKAAATVTADAKSKTYGATDPTLTATVTGAVNSETLNYTLARANGENAGEYAITVTLGSNPNYDVTATNGTFTINKATATVTADAKSKTYGADDPELTATVTGVVNNETLNYTLSRANGENAGTYAITVTLGSNPNYDVTPANGTFTINKATAAVTITGNTGSKTYNGREQSVTGYTVGIPSGVNIQQSEISTTATATAKGTNVGTYTMGLTAAAFGTTNGNYDVTFQVTDGSITINRADATVTADNKTKVAGELDPSFTATVTGLQNGETASVLTYTFSRETGEGVGTYAIKPAGDAQQGNYNVTYVHGTLTITEPACPTMGTTSYTPSTVTASATSITFTTTLNNVASGVTISDATFTVVSDGVANQTLNATYSNGTITATLSGLDNYRGKLIKVTPKVIVSGCSNPGSITGDVVEICVPYATKPSITAVSHTPSNPMGKTDLFNDEGVTLTATVSSYTASQVESRGFLISTSQSDIQSYNEDFVVAGGTVSNNTFKTTSKLGLSYCGKKWFYRAFIKMKGCEEPVLSSINNFQMWGPESATSSSVAGPTVSATPNSVVAGQTVTLNATAYMTVGTGNLGTHPLEEWMHYSDQTWYPGNLSLGYQLIMPSILSTYGITEQAWTYRWEDENGQTIHTSHTSGTTTVNPTQTTTYTAYGEFNYKGEVCRVSKPVTVTVQ